METLKNSREYRRVIEGGNREKLETVTTYRLPNEEGKTRIGISVSRKAGGSVKRNRIKRLIREAARRNMALLPEGEDVVFVARRGIEAASYRDIERDVCRAGGVVKNETGDELGLAERHKNGSKGIPGARI